MGWGICFGIDDNYRVYCADGCRWRAKESDYEGFPKWPSAREYVLEYYEGDAHRELDMIRDEFPGTAAGLAAACPEHIGSAFYDYGRLPEAEKRERHEKKLVEFEAELKYATDEIPHALESYRLAKKLLKEYKTVTKPAKTRMDELERLIAPLQLELDVERAATHVDSLKKEKTRANRLVKMEKTFGTYSR
jgi:hypothetical protein